MQSFLHYLPQLEHRPRPLTNFMQLIIDEVVLQLICDSEAHILVCFNQHNHNQVTFNIPDCHQQDREDLLRKVVNFGLVLDQHIPLENNLLLVKQLCKSGERDKHCDGRKIPGRYNEWKHQAMGRCLETLTLYVVNGS